MNYGCKCALSLLLGGPFRGTELAPRELLVFEYTKIA